MRNGSQMKTFWVLRQLKGVMEVNFGIFDFVMKTMGDGQCVMVGKEKKEREGDTWRVSLSSLKYLAGR